MRLTRCLLLLAALFCAPWALAGVVVMPADAGQMTLHDDLSWWSSPAATLEEARQGRFVDAPAGPGYGIRKTPVWFRATVQNGSQSARDLLLEIGFSKIDFVDVFVEYPDGRSAHWSTGDARPFSTRPLGSPRFVFPLELAAGETAGIYLRLESATIINLPLTVYDAQEYLGVSSRLHGALGLFYGLVLGLLAYNTYLFRSTREMAFLHYVIGGTLAVGYFLSMDGYLAALLQDRTHLAQSLLFIFGTLSVTFTLLFTRGFLELGRLAPRLERLLLWVAAAAAAVALLLPWLPAVLAMGLTIFFSVTMATIMSIAGVLSLRSGFRPARWFVLAISIHLAVLLTVTFAVLAVFPGLLQWADVAHRFGFVLNLVCFTLAIGDRIQHIDGMRREAEDRAVAAAADTRARDEFLSRMSHELRTPMTGVLGMTELLEHTDLAAPQRRYLATLRYSAEMLLNLINNILDHARMQSGRLKLQHEAFDMMRLLDHCRQLFEQQPRSNGVSLTVDVGGGLSRVAVGDAQRLQQVLADLLAQAFRQTSRGVVGLRVRALDTGWVRFEVQCAGVAKSEEARLREELVGAAPASGRNDRALGMSISRQLVTAMGGRIGMVNAGQADALADGHTLYWFELPLNAGS